MLRRWCSCSQRTARDTENQENSQIMNHDESWTRTLRLLRLVLRAHQLNSEYLKVNLLFLFIVCLFLLVLFSFYGNYIANSLSLVICPRVGTTETWSKRWNFQKQIVTVNCYKREHFIHNSAWFSFVFLEKQALVSFPASLACQKLLEVENNFSFSQS